MKVYCKRTKFNQDVDKKGYVKWKKDCWYDFEKPKDYESNYVFGYVSNNYSLYKESILKSTFDKYFYTTEDLRELRINNILKDDSNRM